jgi:probable HAF family extracellular repeat protein
MKSHIRSWSSAAAMILALSVCVAAQDNPLHDNKPIHKRYRLIDLGTFGGPWSSVSFEADAINSSGVSVGGSTTSTLISNGNLYNCFGPYVTHAFVTRNGRAIDLGTLAGDERCSGTQMINDRGDIVGLSEIDALDPIFGFHEMRAVRWRGGQIRNLGTLGGRESAAQSTNNRGQIVGFAVNTAPDPYSFLDFLALGSPDGTQTRAFLWDGVMHDLGTLGGPDGNAVNINERGQVTGFSYTNFIPNPTTGIPTLAPFLWENGSMLNLGTLGGTVGSPVRINQRGQVAGTSNLAGDQAAHPFLWDRGVLRDLGTFGGSNGQATWINDEGAVIGAADFPGDQTHDAFLWRKGVMIDLGNLGATSFPYGINSRGQVVGASRIDGTPGNARAFLWEKGGPMVDLNTLIPPNSSLTLVFAEAISEGGEIGGTGVPAGCQPSDAESCGHAFLLIPDGDCDEGNEARIAASRERIAIAQLAGAQGPGTTRQDSESQRSPKELFRNVMRQRLGLPGTRPTLRD